MDKSLQEHLMDLPLYEKRHSSLIVKLLANYRSHSKILDLPSKMFYNNELLACADVKVVDSMAYWQELPHPEVSLLSTI